MTDYYPLIARAVAGMQNSTGESRRALYDRARTALLGQLRGLDPPLSEAEITREKLGLEEAVRKVEAEAARRPRSDGGGAPAGSPGLDAEEAPSTAAPQRRSVRPERPGEPGQPRTSGRTRVLGERRPLSDEGLKGFRDVVAEADALGEKTAHAAKSAREALASASDAPELDKVEPRPEPEAKLPPPAPPRSTGPMPRRLEPSARSVEPTPLEPAPRPESPTREPPSRGSEARPTPPRPMAPRQPVFEDEEAPRRSSRGIIIGVIALCVLLLVGGGGYLLWTQVSQYVGAMRSTAPPAPTGTGTGTQQSRKIPDRVGQPTATAPAPGTGAQSGAAVAQKVVLYEEDPADPNGKLYSGSAIWRTETVSPGPGLAPELAVRADLEIPDRRITMTMSLRRNTDQALPASHTIEIMFNLPADFPFGGIANVPGILMKQQEDTRGAPLAGLAVKVTSGFFLVGLNAAEGELSRNVQLLKERGWFDIPIVYNNGRRAILAVAKGTPGERAFNDAFAAWGQ